MSSTPSAGTARPYHHGDLRRALVDAGVDLARPEGPDAVTLRAAGRTAGVSHNASYRHFADRDALLRAVAERCMSELALLLERRSDEILDDDPVLAALLRFRASGLAYLEFALTEPGWFRTAFAVPRSLDHFAPGEGAGEEGQNAYELLNARLDELVTVGVLPALRRPGLETAVWSMVHGLATLLIDGPLRDISAEEREDAIAGVVEFVARGI